MKIPQQHRAEGASSHLYPSTVFLGAFLLFSIQPIAGKYLLPFFGGSSSVWTMSLLFFTVLLFSGYLYVYMLSKCSTKKQVVIHISAICIALTALLSLYFLRSAYGFLPRETGAPFVDVLLALMIYIGASYFILATTGPLLQFWFAVSEKREPYRLYALSNVASLIALLMYPFVVEPFIGLHYQENIWIALFIVYAILCTGSALKFYRSTSERSSISGKRTDQAARVRLTTYLGWIGFAALPSFMLVATTTQMTEVIAPVPLLWVVPLALYLLTFIFAFEGRGQSLLVPLLLCGSAVIAYFSTYLPREGMVLQMSSFLLVLFLCGLFCHTQLYRLRPDALRSPLFYLLIAFGGMVGSASASIAAPLFFSDFFEFPLGVAFSTALAICLLSPLFFPRILNRGNVRITKMILVLFIGFIFLNFTERGNAVLSVSSRNFYGNAKVLFEDSLTALVQGTTLHGAQFTGKDKRLLPTTYYTPGSGIGRALLYEEQIRADEPLDVGIIGLGVGGLAAYCRPGDTFVFYEIDERISMLAKTYFDYLSHCEGAEVRIGDGRILLQREHDISKNAGHYDVLAVDAFSGDAIPVHLLTLEAFQLYAKHLRSPDSIIAVHISNRYLDLAPVVLGVAAELHLNAMIIRDAGESGLGASPSVWVLLATGADVFPSTVFAHTDSALSDKRIPVWTDNYSSVLQVLNLP